MNSTPATLKLLIPADLDAVMDIETIAHSHPWKRQNMDDSLAGHHRCVGAFVGEELRGFYVASAAGGDAELLDIAVHPMHRGQGLAVQLMDDLMGWAEKKAETLFLEVRVSNSRAIALYQAYEFIEVGERPNYYPTVNGKEHALIMARYLR
ncbi:ribosomal protein S18-alanine N-acetyltransferase [Simiduia sp. 21SJ11W-1]|uniref:ribosomal protein S18-alanine N-acetyltransferase n=1 Tax=Simiduia sp. 21SJ11W-1 TaxID=2909669 RepID=UPI00209E22D4|nr:ribosomal protein S18-alanine N-acetyltransferase [Simiduia sp. 21SJ11W-1]UTA47323.1 ribosomal protein S18-alanine N-acetyltransferase [Simiduia sp. 21SJ11W-1]